MLFFVRDSLGLFCSPFFSPPPLPARALEAPSRLIDPSLAAEAEAVRQASARAVQDEARVRAVARRRQANVDPLAQQLEARAKMLDSRRTALIEVSFLEPKVGRFYNLYLVICRPTQGCPT